jgi:mannose-6-phosphate isomerase-like protein (cupin superfamily)
LSKDRKKLNLDTENNQHLNKYIVTVQEGIEKITQSGMFRKRLLVSENIGIKSFEMGILMLHPGQSWDYPDHRHDDEEAYFILEGKETQVIGEKEFHIEKYMSIYLPPNSLHITKNTGNEPLWVLYIRKPEKYR